MKLSKLHSSRELSYTTSTVLRKDGNEDAAKLINEITQTTPNRAKKIRASWEIQKKNKNPSLMSTEEALSIIITASLSKFQYNILRSNAKNHNHELYPSYYQVLAAKIDSYPDNIIITEEKCEVTKYINTLYNFHLFYINILLGTITITFKPHCKKTFAKHFYKQKN